MAHFAVRFATSALLAALLMVPYILKCFGVAEELWELLDKTLYAVPMGVAWVLLVNNAEGMSVNTQLVLMGVISWMVFTFILMIPVTILYALGLRYARQATRDRAS